MRIVTRLPQGDWHQVGPFAAAAERDGYDGVLAVETAHEPFMPLALAAMATSRVEVATGIALAFPRSPMVVAHAAWELHRNSGGRLSLGLGSQVRAHVVRRFGAEWSAPASRLREYVQALHAVWDCWRRGDARLAFEGEHYRLSLMTPEFTPPPSPHPPIPVTIAAVGEAMMKVAARVCDGVRLHSFATAGYVREVALPALEAVLARRGLAREHFEVIGGGFVVTGADEAAVAAALEPIRYRVAFYASTPAYRPVLAVHGLEELGERLHAMSRGRRWDEMAAQVDDDVLALFVAAAPYERLPDAIETRFAGLADTVSVDLPLDLDPELRREIVARIRALPSRFVGRDAGEA